MSIVPAPGETAPASSPAGRPAWRPWTAPAALLGGFGAALLVGLVLSVIAAIGGASVGHAPPWVTIAATVAQDVALVGSALLFASIAARPRPEDFGFAPVALRLAAAGAALTYLGFVLFSYAWLAAVGQTQTHDTIVQDLGAHDSVVALVAVTFLVTVLAPLAEETFFRGYYFGALRGLGLWPAAALTGLTFGAVHAFGSPIAFLVPLAFFGAALCLLRERTGSLYPGMLVHCVNNTLALATNEHWGWPTALVLVAALAVLAAIVRGGVAVWRRVLVQS